MNNKFNQLFSELSEQLHFLKLEETNPIKWAEEAIEIILNCLILLKKTFSSEKAKTQEYEIEFFKVAKPQFIAQLIFYTAVLDIETKLPQGSKESVKKYLKNELKTIDNFFMINAEFLKYYKGDFTHLDEKYFIRKNFDVKLALDNIHNVTDKKFTTSHDITVAKIIANQLIAKYITDKMDDLDSKNIKSQVEPNSVNWTGKKVDLVELLYALHSDGSINSGGITLKDLAVKFELFFNIKLEGYSRTFIEIQERKTERTKFLTSIEISLINKMDRR
jgi:hypothetical protein